MWCQWARISGFDIFFSANFKALLGLKYFNFFLDILCIGLSNIFLPRIILFENFPFPGAAFLLSRYDPDMPISGKSDFTTVKDWRPHDNRFYLVPGPPFPSQVGFCHLELDGLTWAHWLTSSFTFNDDTGITITFRWLGAHHRATTVAHEARRRPSTATWTFLFGHRLYISLNAIYFL